MHRLASDANGCCKGAQVDKGLPRLVLRVLHFLKQPAMLCSALVRLRATSRKPLATGSAVTPQDRLASSHVVAFVLC